MMPILQVNANFNDVVAELREIRMALQHAVRIFEMTFPLNPREVFTVKPPSEELRVVSDEQLIEAEEEAARKRAQSEPAEEEPGRDLDEFYTL